MLSSSPFLPWFLETGERPSGIIYVQVICPGDQVTDYCSIPWPFFASLVATFEGRHAWLFARTGGLRVVDADGSPSTSGPSSWCVSNHPPPRNGTNLRTVCMGMSIPVHSVTGVDRKYDTSTCNTLTWLTTTVGPKCCSMSIMTDSRRLIRSL